MEMTGGEALALQLVREGVTQVFGVPGVQLDYAMDGLARVTESIAFRNTRHEQSAAYMADGYARTTGEAGVFMVVPGPGVLNAGAGLATAYACSSPVVCIAGQIPSPAIGRGLGLLHEIPDQSGILGSLTKWSAAAATPADVPRVLHEAFGQLRSGRPRPVAVEVPPDVLQARGEVTLIEAAQVSTAPVEPDDDLVREAAALLRTAERPVLYVGSGVVAADACAELRAVAEALQAPVVMSRNGRGALSDRHPLALPVIGGPYVLPDADVVLAVGTRFVTNAGEQVPTGTGTRLVLLNAEAADLAGPRRPSLAIHGDARLGLAGLLDHLDGLEARPSRGPELDTVRALCEKQVAELEPQRSWVRALRAAIPDDGVLVSELTQVGYVAAVGYPVYEPRTYLTPGYQGTLGYGFPAALGAKVARPDRAVVSITGDGGFGWNLPELATARKYSIGLVTVVFDDGAFGNVRRSQREDFDGRYIGTELANPDFVALAEAFGVAGTRATTPEQLVGVLREALSGGEPVLVDVPVGEMPNPWHLLHTPPATSSS